MTNSPTKASPRTIYFIWIAFLIAPVFYTVMSWFANSSKEALALPMPMTAAFVMAAVASIIAGYVLPGIVARQQMAEKGDDLPPLAIYQTSMIVRWACFESVAIYGFVLSIVSCQFLTTVVGAVLAIALIAGSRPRPDDVVDRT